MDARRGIGLASVVVGAMLALVGALDWVYVFLWSGGSFSCYGNVCYQTIVEPAPWYAVAILPAGLVVLLIGIFLLTQGGRAGPRP